MRHRQPRAIHVQRLQTLRKQELRRLCLSHRKKPIQIIGRQGTSAKHLSTKARHEFQEKTKRLRDRILKLMFDVVLVIRKKPVLPNKQWRLNTISL